LSHKLTQRNKESHWLKVQAKQTELDIDEALLEESGETEEHQEAQRQLKNNVRKMRAELKVLLSQPLEVQVPTSRGGITTISSVNSSNSSNGGKKNKKGSKDMAANQVVDWRKRKAGFFVYAK
jgi:hypothetical protein